MKRVKWTLLVIVMSCSGLLAACANTAVTRLGTMELPDGTCSEGQIDSLQDVVHQEMSVVRTFRCPCGETPTPNGSCEAEIQAVVGNPSVLKTLIGGASAVGAAAVFPATTINNAVSAAAQGGSGTGGAATSNATSSSSATGGSVGDITVDGGGGGGAPGGPL